MLMIWFDFAGQGHSRP